LSMSGRVCLVCDSPIHVAYLRIDACRACATFFKRTLRAGRSYSCRRGCLNMTRGKLACPSCRFKRCEEIGLSYLIPLKKRSRNGTWTVAIDTQAMTISDTLIDRMATAYRDSCCRRLLHEKSYIYERELWPFAHSSEELYTGDFASFYGIFRLVMRESASLMPIVFRYFERYSNSLQVSLFRNFLSKFIMIECIYLTSKYFRNRQVFMASLITVADIENIGDWTVGSTIMHKDDFNRNVMDFTIEYIDLLTPVITRCDLSEKEFHAL
ncbi:hypothetical protein PMAYCL1PPCAC_10432, partial [Pristionchus mayeri]